MLLLLILIPLLSLLFFFFFLNSNSNSNSNSKVPKSYPLVGSFFAFLANRKRLLPWLSGIMQVSPSSTFVLRRNYSTRQVFSVNPAVVQHILKTNFSNYGKGHVFNLTLTDFLGHGIFNIDGDSWKFQRQVSSHEFNTKSLRKFIETVVDTELSDRLIPILSSAAKQGTVLDFQDILQRFAFDNICKIAFGFDPAYLLPSLPQAKFALAFEDGVRISSERFSAVHPVVWKFKKLLNIGSEKRLKNAISEVREFALNMIKEKKQRLGEKESLDSVDLLSRFLSSGHSDENFVTDIVISFILAGRDTTSAALTWFFWLLWKNPEIESEILNEINEKSEAPVFDEVKDMVYTHASLCESMRLYPPVPMASKEAVNDDILPGGTVVKKGMKVTYFPYAMGRLEMLWGSDWAEFKPERWLQKEEESWKFVGRDPYTYPVFQAGPRICLGKEMAFLQMKRVVAGVLRRFEVVPAFEEGVNHEPEFVSYLTSKMKGGFPVKIVERVHVHHHETES
ncbi:cytochrome P450 94A1-like [Quercus lobata]|uniref:Cytochrome P450 n=1 Tax=Quercus lobata TaxID=97700 RepID=A0A7N2KU74_QUELO|nr:cytochrome P450 94A1-like [Quercus lobata]